MQNREANIKRVKIFSIGFVIILIILLIISLLSPKTIYVSEAIIIKSHPDLVISAIAEPENFNYWNPWLGLDTNVIYHFQKETAKAPAIVSWEDPKSNILRGSLKILKNNDKNILKIEADFGKQGSGLIEFSVLYTDNGATSLRIEYQAKFGWNLEKRLYGLFAKSYLKEDFKRALEKIKKMIEENPELLKTPQKIDVPAMLNEIQTA